MEMVKRQQDIMKRKNSEETSGLKTDIYTWVHIASFVFLFVFITIIIVSLPQNT